MAQAIVGGYQVDEISVPTRHFAEASTINFRCAVSYGLDVVRASLRGFAVRIGLHRLRMFPGGGGR